MKTRVVLNSDGQNFSALPTGLISASAGVELPQVFVKKSGTQAERELGGLHYLDGRKLSATVSARSELDPGLYEALVQNPNGRRSDLVGILDIVPPPVITSVEIDGRPSEPLAVCAGSDASIRITGSGFRPADSVPKVQLLSCTNNADPSSCGDLLAELTSVRVESETTLTATLPAGSLPVNEKSIGLRIVNPEETPCTATQLVSFLTAKTELSVNSSVPSQSWTGVDTPIQVYGQGFGPDTQLKLLPSDPSFAPVELLDERADASGTRIDATVPAGASPGSGYRLVATDVAGCESGLDNDFTILANASLTISQVVSPFSWTQRSASLALLGEGFQSTPRAYLIVPDASPRLQPLFSTSFVNEKSLGATVRKGLPVGGPYDVVVINPDGGGGKMDAGYRVSASPPPSVEDVTPAIGDTQTNATARVHGCDFRAPLKVELVGAGQTTSLATVAGDPVCDGPASCEDGSKRCHVDVTIPTTQMEVGGYVIRATNEDENTWGDWSLFAVTLPSGKLDTWTTAPGKLQVPRRDLVALGGRVNVASRFIYAVGGKGGATPAALDSVEIVPIDAFGNVGTPFVQRYHLNTAREQLSGFQRDGFLYAMGGSSNGTDSLDTVERAKILTLDEKPEVSEPTLTGGNVGLGSWYYQVSAFFDDTNLDNPGGEALPSDELVVSLSRPSGVKLAWEAVEGAAGYRIYRTATPNGRSTTEVFLAQVEANTLSFVDDGSLSVDSQRSPLRLGSTGVWVTLPEKLRRARRGANTLVGTDPNGVSFAYALGGYGDCGGGIGEMNCVEYAKYDAATKTLGAWTESAQTMVSPRYLAGGCVGEHGKDPQIPDGESWFYLSGGSNATANFESAQVSTGGELSVWSALAPPVSAEPGERTGHRMEMVANAMFVMGGVAGASASGDPLGNAQFSQKFDSGPQDRSNFSNSTAELAVPRSHFGSVVESGMFYAVGGASGANGAQLTGTIEFIVY